MWSYNGAEWFVLSVFKLWSINGVFVKAKQILFQRDLKPPGARWFYCIDLIDVPH